nr:macro domain-containing protein [Providencia sp. PROV019]
MWYGANHLTEINLSIDGSKVSVLVGDLFEQSGSKVIAFNEYFDTQVDDIIITKNSLNGIYINKYFGRSVAELDQIIDNNHFLDGELIEKNVKRLGKSKKYKLGTICKLDDYLLVAFSKFDSKNRAVLTMPEYLEFLINFWDSINRVYARKSVSVPIFGSGITRIKEHKNISDEELLKIMLWTFRISEMRFKHPAKLNIVIHHDKIDSINLQSIKSMGNGF